MKITIVGCGSTGIGFAADMIEKGHEVTIYEQANYQKNPAELKAAGKITRVGYGPKGDVPLPELSEDLQSIHAADVIVIAVIANRHSEISALIAPYLHDGQAVLFFNGNCGSLILKPLLKGKDVVVGETSSTYTSLRYLGKGVISYAMPVVEPKPAAAFPASDNKKLTEAFRPCYALSCAPDGNLKNVLECTLNEPNVTVHLISSVTNIGAMEHSPDFRLYRDGMSPSLLKLIDGIQKERDAILEKFGYQSINFVPMMNKIINFEEHPDPGLSGFRLTTGPDSTMHRYINEDAFAGDALLISMGNLVGVKTPLLHAAITIASTVNEYDYLKEGLSLSKLGLADMTPEKINNYLINGV